MKEIVLCLLGVAIMTLSFTLMELEDQTKLTKEQIKIMNIYCKAYEPCKKEMEK